MPKIAYIQKAFTPENQRLIDLCIDIIEEYTKQGFSLTLRQLYYQCVARDLLPQKWADKKTGSVNNVNSYKNLGSLINDARLAGQIDWNAIEDRTRNLHSLPSWDTPADIIDACAKQFRNPKWKDQPCHVEVWIEKEALSGVFERVCDELQIPFFACRGYTSQSEMWAGAMRLKKLVEDEKEVHILHFGDHDPSGMDMTRDIIERLEMFMGGIELKRMALNMDQVKQYNPPPNPAKITDSRAGKYIRTYGDESWELDALEPSVLATMVRRFVQSRLDKKLWKAALEEEAEHRRLLGVVSDQWDDLTDKL